MTAHFSRFLSVRNKSIELQAVRVLFPVTVKCFAEKESVIDISMYEFCLNLYTDCSTNRDERTRIGRRPIADALDRLKKIRMTKCGRKEIL